MRNGKKGFTLLEIVVAIAILAVIAALILLGTLGTMRMVSTVDSNTAKDAQGNQALRTISNLLRPAILPVPGAKTPGGSAEGGSVFVDLNRADIGFGNATGKKWRERLNAGMDAIAFIVPVDMQEAGDFLDDSGRLQTGQNRPDGKGYLGSTPLGTPNTGTGFLARDPGSSELVNVLAAVDPDKFASPRLEAIVSPSDWQALVADGGNWPEITCFTAIRYLPRLDASGDPQIIHEKNLGPNGTDVDLDGDGDTDGRFQIGRLQVLYTGGRMPTVVDGAVVWRDMPQITVNVTSDVILRKAEPAERTPLFRLVDFSSDNIADTEGNSGGIIEGVGEGSVLAIRLLILDSRGLDDETLNLNPYLLTLDARWYETKVILRNMSR